MFTMFTEESHFIIDFYPIRLLFFCNLRSRPLVASKENASFKTLDSSSHLGCFLTASCIFYSIVLTKSVHRQIQRHVKVLKPFIFYVSSHFCGVSPGSHDAMITQTHTQTPTDSQGENKTGVAVTAGKHCDAFPSPHAAAVQTPPKVISLYTNAQLYEIPRSSFRTSVGTQR